MPKHINPAYLTSDVYDSGKYDVTIRLQQHRHLKLVLRGEQIKPIVASWASDVVVRMADGTGVVSLHAPDDILGIAWTVLP